MAESSMTHVVTFCGQCNCGCPELFVDPDARAEARIVITDDFGDRIRMSVEQLEAIIAEAASGRLSGLVAGHLAAAL